MKAAPNPRKIDYLVQRFLCLADCLLLACGRRTFDSNSIRRLTRAARRMTGTGKAACTTSCVFEFVPAVGTIDGDAEMDFINEEIHFVHHVVRIVGLCEVLFLT